MDTEKKEQITQAVRFAYDLQKLRIQQGNRAGPQADHAEAALDEKQKIFLHKASDRLSELEKDAFKEMGRLLKGVPIYETFLKDVKGVGPTMAGVLVSSINIENCETASQLWAWCGLAVKNGEAQRRRKGEKAGYNPWLKAKLVKVMGDCMIKARSPYREFYDNYKHRKQNQLVEMCMLCKGEGKYEKKKCSNCAGTGGPCAWGRSDAHRHQAALRYMVKMFLLELWRTWRELEGLPVRPPYAEEYLGRVHHGGEAA